jgi:hypothetical protein
VPSPDEPAGQPRRHIWRQDQHMGVLSIACSQILQWVHIHFPDEHNVGTAVLLRQSPGQLVAQNAGLVLLDEF